MANTDIEIIGRIERVVEQLKLPQDYKYYKNTYDIIYDDRLFYFTIPTRKDHWFIINIPSSIWVGLLRESNPSLESLSYFQAKIDYVIESGKLKDCNISTKNEKSIDNHTLIEISRNIKI